MWPTIPMATSSDACGRCSLAPIASTRRKAKCSMATSRQGMGSFMTDDHEDLKDQCMNDPFWAADEIERLTKQVLVARIADTRPGITL